ncbi:conserved hypothetical protein [Culex quinquefasciatus]|uniref:Uncharacterized protein n=1 Tax=Culex quinquefasciatus TaxID=7176 RepID=B0W7F5_CULQU|nr:conserved hypothetical protein [Culex quinquefasciatus]|eukprot:XP_001844639.1 conserved hypothetical protein [Culex quinquefasciatus]
MASSIIDKPLVYQGCKIPIYLDNNATEVRVLDLPLGISNDDVVKVMSKYGEVLTITNDRWINFFPGIPNGVRTLRMLLKQPTPKSITDFLRISVSIPHTLSNQSSVSFLSTVYPSNSYITVHLSHRTPPGRASSQHRLRWMDGDKMMMTTTSSTIQNHSSEMALLGIVPEPTKKKESFVQGLNPYRTTRWTKKKKKPEVSSKDETT